MGIRDLVKPGKYDKQVYGVDTETYNNPTFGLKSIQIANDKEAIYLTVDDWTQDDLTIRFDISRQFADWIDNLHSDTTLAFFNMAYDFSQVVYYFVNKSQFTYVEHTERLQPGQFRILESDRALYKVDIRNHNGARIIMLDIANFLTATTLDKACKEWINQEKIKIESKDFLKAPASELEIKYALEDARLTCRLYNQLHESGVIEGRNITIAGRTISHFKQYLRDNYAKDFNTWAWGTNDKDIVAQYTAKAE